MHSFTIEVSGQMYQGTWIEHARGTIEVRSDYGAREDYLEGRDPASAARDLLRNIVAPLYRALSN
jgi:hypothetical protein